jgi:choline-glycine betaine transporter
MIPYSSIGDIATTLLQYLAIIGIVAFGCLPSLTVSEFRSRLDSWPTDRFPVNYLLLVSVIALGQVVAIVVGWQVLHIGSTQTDPQFRELRLIAVLIAYPITMLGLGTIGVRLYYWQRSMEQWLTLRTIAGLGVAAGMYIVTIIGAAIVLFIAALFFALPT